MRSTTDITRKSLLLGSAWGVLALAAGCAKPAASGETAPSAVPSASPSTTAGNATAAWSYEGTEGPADWGNLNPAFQTCSTGTTQSPINIESGTAKSSSPMTLAYSSSECEIQDNGHTVELRAASPQSLTVDGKKYSFKQLHFHDPSEHTVQGTRYDAEFHFVHQSDDGALAVVAVLAKSGAANAAWAPFIDAAPDSDSARSIGIVDLAALLPASLDHYAYEGSLTTPPCSENVLWLLLETPVELSPDQINKLGGVHSGNNRPTQQLNNRVVTVVDQ